MMRDLRTFLRLLWLQSLMNSRLMQGNGYEFSLRHVRGQEGECEESIPYFNTHPWLAPAFLGTVQQGMQEDVDGYNEKEARITWMGTLGALGDGLIWTVLRPIAVVASLFLMWLDIRLFWVVPSVFWITGLSVRWIGYRIGLRGAGDLVQAIGSLQPSRRILQGQALVIRSLFVVAGIFAAAAAASLDIEGGGGRFSLMTGLILLLVAGTRFLSRWRYVFVSIWFVGFAVVAVL